MPSLPTIPPPAPSFLLSPEVGLAGFVGVVVVVFSAWFLGGRVVQKLAERRRTRIADAENSDNIASVVLERRVKGYSITAADVLVAARTALETTKSTAATKTHLSSLHKALMSTTSAKSIFSTDAPVTVRLAPGSRVLLSQKGEQHAPGRFMVRTPRARLGPSPLRVVFAAPESADSLVSPRLGSKSPRSVAPVAVVDESPIASTQPPVALTLSALILSRLHESDSASDS
ncbi:hypothetical protein DFH09DRAFT_1317381 [Mycena vulgaris]|nr:hypothetical protein DFH09DRAFT_1317381 [Mycena vulgaris]